MSGILGVGSKSGIIGSTEIPGGYETGDWTPVAGGGTGTLTLSNAGATYTKIGNIVHLSCYQGFSASGGNGDFIISGLPYAGVGGGGAGSIYCRNLNTALSGDGKYWSCIMAGAIYVRPGGEVTATYDARSNFDNGSSFWLEITYECAR